MSFNHSRAFVQFGEIRIEISGVSFPRRYFTTDGGYFTQGFAIVGHVGHYNQYVHIFIECQMFCKGQCGPWCDQPLNRRVISKRQKEGDVFEGSAFLKGAGEEPRYVMLYSHRSENNGELGIRSPYFCLPCDLCSKFIVGQAVAGKNREFLAADERIHSINNRNTGLYEIPGVLSSGRIDRHSIDVQLEVASLRRPSVDGMSQAVE